MFPRLQRTQNKAGQYQKVPVTDKPATPPKPATKQQPHGSRVDWLRAHKRWIAEVAAGLVVVGVVLGAVLGALSATGNLYPSSSNDSLGAPSSSSTGGSASSSSSSGGGQPSSSSSSSPATGPSQPMIVSMGQSNNQGEGCCVNASIDSGYSNMLQYYIGDGSGYGYAYGGSTAQAAQWILTPANEPLYNGGSNRLNIIGNLVSLGKRYIDQYQPSGNLLLIQSAVGSTSISRWVPSDLLGRAQTAVASAIALQPGTTVTMFTWIQGEADAGSSTYQSDLLALINLVRLNTVGANATTPFVVGSMLPEYTLDHGGQQTIYNIHRSIPNLVPYTAFRNAPLGFVDCYEEIHFSATGQRLMGELLLQGYHDALLNTQTGKIPGHPTGLTASLDSQARVALTWTADTSNADAPITNYWVVWKLYQPNMVCSDGDSSAPHRILTNSTNTAFTFPIGWLLNDSRYVIDVNAVSGTQPSSGSWSSWQIVYTATTNPPPVYNNPPSTAGYTASVPFVAIPAQSSLVNIVDGLTFPLDVGSVTYPVDHYRGSVAYFNSADFVTSYTIPANYTICVWFSILAGYNFPWAFVSFGGQNINSAAFAAGITSQGLLFHRRIQDVNANTWHETDYQIPSFGYNTFYHVCYTWEYGTGIANIYLNGTVVANSSFPVSTWRGGDLIRVGAGASLAYPLFGLVQALCVWNSSIDAKQIAHFHYMQLTKDQVSVLADYL